MSCFIYIFFWEYISEMQYNCAALSFYHEHLFRHSSTTLRGGSCHRLHQFTSEAEHSGRPAVSEDYTHTHIHTHKQKHKHIHTITHALTCRHTRTHTHMIAHMYTYTCVGTVSPLTSGNAERVRTLMCETGACDQLFFILLCSSEERLSLFFSFQPRPLQ